MKSDLYNLQEAYTEVYAENKSLQSLGAAAAMAGLTPDANAAQPQNSQYNDITPNTPRIEEVSKEIKDPAMSFIDKAIKSKTVFTKGTQVTDEQLNKIDPTLYADILTKPEESLKLIYFLAGIKGVKISDGLFGVYNKNPLLQKKASSVLQPSTPKN